MPLILVILRLTTDTVVSTQVQVLDVYLIHLLYKAVRNCVDLGLACYSTMHISQGQQQQWQKVPTIVKYLLRRSQVRACILSPEKWSLLSQGAPVKAC